MKITKLDVRDIRFPTSRELDGSDAMNPDPDYSCAYVILKTDGGPEGRGLTFTIGRGNELCVAAAESLAYLVEGLDLDDIRSDLAGFWRRITSDSQLRWVGPEKGPVHMAVGAIVNAVWDLLAKQADKPLWQLLTDMTADEIVSAIDFRYITDALTPEQARDILLRQQETKAERVAEMLRDGYPAYTTSAGWLGYPDDKLRSLCRTMMEAGWRHFKIKVGRDLEDDRRRCRIIREEIGPDAKMMIDANQVWDVDQAIEWISALKEFNPWFVEEPTCPDDVLGHAAIARGVAPIRIATGEMCQNRVLFKQFMQSGGLQVCQIDSCRIGGVNEILAVMLLAARFEIPVCPHAGGVGLCEYVQHLAIFDYVSVSGTLDNRIAEYAAHLHEHFETPLTMQNGRYMPPVAPGYSVDMRDTSLNDYEFPGGRIWRTNA